MSTQTSGTHQVELEDKIILQFYSRNNKTHFVCSSLPIFISFIFSNNPDQSYIVQIIILFCIFLFSHRIEVMMLVTEVTRLGREAGSPRPALQ